MFKPAVMTWQMVLVAATGGWAWVQPPALIWHTAASLGLGFTTLWHWAEASRDADAARRRKSGLWATLSLLAVALLGLAADGDAMALGHVGAAIVLAAAFVVVHVRKATFSAGELVEAVAWTMASWLPLSLLLA